MKHVFILIFLSMTITTSAQKIKAKKINFENTPTFENLKDSTIYSLNKSELSKLISSSTKKYSLLISYGFWCKPCQELMPKILTLVKNSENDINIYILNIEPDDSKRLFLHQNFLNKRFDFFKANFMVSEEYGGTKWQKYDSFLLDLIGQARFNKTYTGMSQIILYENSKKEIIYLSNYNLSDQEILTDINNILIKN